VVLRNLGKNENYIASFYEIEAYEGSPEVWDQAEHLLDMTEADISLANGDSRVRPYLLFYLKSCFRLLLDVISLCALGTP
jgi:hypothetical protein